MKKFLSLIAAVLMALTLAGCETSLDRREKQLEEDRKDLQERIDKAEYSNEAGNLIKKYLNTLSQYSNSVKNVSEWEDGVSRTKTFLNQANEYLSELEELEPPSEEKSFHRDLLQWVSFAYDFNNALADVWEDPDANKILEANDKVITTATKFDNKIAELKEEKDWFKKAVESAGF